MTKKILTGIAVVAAFSLMATTVLAGPGDRNERRNGWKTTRPAQVRIVPRVEKIRFSGPFQIKKEAPGLREVINNGRGGGICPRPEGRF